MATVNNQDTIREIIKATKLDANIDKVPDSFSSSIVPVIEVNPRLLKTARVLGAASQATTGTVTAVSTSTTDETFVTGIQTSFVKNVTCDIATGSIAIQAVIDGATVMLGRFSVLTLTAERGELPLMFNPPIKVDKNSVINITGAFTAGALMRNLIVFGYTQSP
jgi:hypothetical protein